MEYKDMAALAALQGLCLNPAYAKVKPELIAQKAYAIANAMAQQKQLQQAKRD